MPRYLDLYILTGENLFLYAVEGAWEMFRNYWIHVGGSIAMNEERYYAPASYYLTTNPTGELCGSSFWIRVNQRFHQLRPTVEVYTWEIERSLLNVVLAAQTPPNASAPGIRYFAQLQVSAPSRRGHAVCSIPVLLIVGRNADCTTWCLSQGFKHAATNHASCCESQGTRTFGALPEFVYSTDSSHTNVVYVNLYANSTYKLSGVELEQRTTFPLDGKVGLQLTPTSAPVTLMVRVPGWSANPTVPITVLPAVSSTGEADPARVIVGQRASYTEISLSPGDSLHFDTVPTLETSL